MARIVQYLRVYREFVATSYAEALSFRAHFVLSIVMELVFYVSTLATIDFLYLHVERIGVWNREQFLFFVCYMLMVNQLHTTFVAPNFWMLSEKIRRGQLDFDLLKPLHLFFTLFFRYLRPQTLLTLPICLCLLLYYGVIAGLPVWGWVVLPPLILLSTLLLVAFEILVSALMFVTIDGTGINFLRMQAQSLARWPDFVFSPEPRRLLTFVIPVLMIGSAPVRFLFDPHDSLLLLSMFPVLAALALANRWVWRRALESYSSASS